ncbi:hypothetical protein BGX33_004636, partial [Mortierella sp. NVP41]
MEQWGPLIEAERQRDILAETLTTEEEESRSLGCTDPILEIGLLSSIKKTMEELDSED